MERFREHAVAGIAVATGLYVAAALLGRATAVDDRSMSLVWPATGVAVLWFLTLTRRRTVAVSAVLVTGATIAVNVATRSAPGPQIAVLVVASLAQVALVVILVRRWCPELGKRGGRPPLETPGSLLRFLAAAALGCFLGILLGLVGLQLAGASFAPVSGLTWWGRNVCGVLAVGTAGLLLIDRLTTRRDRSATPYGGRSLEAATLIATTVALVGLDYGTGQPFAFLLPATTVWAGLRFSPLVVSSHAVLGGVAIIWLTLTGHGLFTDADSATGNALLAQLFAGMTIMIGMFLASARQQSILLSAELDQRRRDLEAFARRAAHDLQQPLMVIAGWTGLLDAQLSAASNGSAPPDRELDMVRRIQASASQMRLMVSGLLSDAIARGGQVTEERVDLTVLAREIAESRGHADVIQVDDIPLVAGDGPLLRRVLDNLIGNSLKYVGPGERPRIEVTGRRHRDGMVCVTVTDRGIGLPEGSHQTIFEEFARAHGDAYPGTGLGLSICRRIVERHGGDICARSRTSGPGIAVEFRLPAWQTHAARPTHGPEQRSPALATSERH
ncbi:ATP-binding protein [Nocardioides bizhenqiangii]|uniref:Sensor-like histidine kinase SenX3 n=1 Tax=Nocardioides bizhenqiangii TaxID=3095076 RepID=A0ABZ0ZR85_9ACTN|nr:ATP-binding protein [Nocardioides sp. HM61]WQQ26374.1 ATP-binding protein [Nocardioides sp. HM61]